MKEINVRDLKPGTRLAKPIISRTGITMLESGTTLTKQYIERLKRTGIHSVFIHDEEHSESLPVTATEIPEIPSLVSPQSHPPAPAEATFPARTKWSLLSRKQREEKKNNDTARKKACARLLQLTDAEGNLQNMAPLFQEQQHVQAIRDIFREIVSERQLADELGVLFQTDRYIFEHSLRVGVLAGVMGLAKRFDQVRLYDLVLGGLLFDIGMTTIPQELLCKKQPLQQEEKVFIRQHTIEGYRILTSTPGVPHASAQCALLHHERYRGEGYPFGLKGEDVPEVAQIVGLADVYDALKSPRHHRNAFTPGEVVEYLFAAGNFDFDFSLVWLFLKNVWIYPVSSIVRLSSGQIGIVSHSAHSYRPIVKIVREADGTPVIPSYEVDLLRDSKLTIVDAYVGLIN